MIKRVRLRAGGTANKPWAARCHANKSHCASKRNSSIGHYQPLLEREPAEDWSYFLSYKLKAGALKPVLLPGTTRYYQVLFHKSRVLAAIVLEGGMN